jgi:AcrR family transcriptional regulator
VTNYDFRHSSLDAIGQGIPVNVQTKTRPEDTRARIMETADTLFRRLGYAKTTVADIAAELRMSPANIYRFFPSKTAIVQAMCQRCLNEAEDRIWGIARSRGPAGARLERLELELLAYHKENLLEDQKISEVVQIAMEESWAAILAHKEVIRNAIELILRDGVEAKEFESIDPRETSALIMRAFASFCHPALLAQGLQEGNDLESEARALIRFLLRAITPRK